MSSLSSERTFDKIRYDIHDIDKQLRRIADALDRAYPKRKLEDVMDTDNPPQRSEPWGGM